MASPVQRAARRRHLGAALRIVHDHGPTRQADISDRLGVNRTTGASLVDELLHLGLVVETHDVEPGRRGRPSPTIAPAAEVVVVAAELAVDRARVDLVQLGGTIRVGTNLDIAPADLGPTDALKQAADAVVDLLAREPRTRVVGTGVAVHGAVDRSGRIVFAPNQRWGGADIGLLDELLGSSLPTTRLPPVVVGNNANLAALAESRRGAGRGVQSFVYVASERGIGGGIVVDGAVLTGVTGLAGEIGHVKIGRSRALCGCGQRGCWEAELGRHAISAKARGVPVEDLLDRAQAGERAAARVVASTATWLGRGLAELIPILQPAAVVLGDHLGRVFELGEANVREAIAASCPAPLAADVAIVPGHLGIDAAPLGAAELAFQRLLDDPATQEDHR